MQINVDDVTEEQARAIETALTDKVFKAQAIMLGVLSTLPSDRARRRVLKFVQDRLEEDEATLPASKIEKHLTSFFEEIPFEAPESADTRHGRLLGEYSRLMHQFGIDSGSAKAWLEAHKGDKQLIELAKVARSLKLGLFAQAGLPLPPAAEPPILPGAVFITSDGYHLHWNGCVWADGDHTFFAGSDFMPVDRYDRPLEGRLETTTPTTDEKTKE